MSDKILPIFYDINQKILTKGCYFQNFSWFKFCIYKLCMIMDISIAPYTTVLKWVSSRRLYAKNGSHFVRKWFLFMWFLEKSYKLMQKIWILTFLRVPSIWNLGVCWNFQTLVNILAQAVLLQPIISVAFQNEIKVIMMAFSDSKWSYVKEALDKFSLIPNFFQKSSDFYTIRRIYLCNECMCILTCNFNSVTKIWGFFFHRPF